MPNQNRGGNCLEKRMFCVGCFEGIPMFLEKVGYSGLDWILQPTCRLISGVKSSIPIRSLLTDDLLKTPGRTVYGGIRGGKSNANSVSLFSLRFLWLITQPPFLALFCCLTPRGGHHNHIPLLGNSIKHIHKLTFTQSLLLFSPFLYSNKMH